MLSLTILTRFACTILLLAFAEATYADRAPLTQEEIEAFVAALEVADVNETRMQSMRTCLADEDDAATTLREELQVRIGELQRTKNQREQEVAAAKSLLEQAAKEESDAHRNQDIAQWDMQQALAEVAATRKAYQDCRKAIRFLGEVLCSPVLAVHGFDILIHKTLDKLTKAKADFIKAHKAAETARDAAQAATARRNEAQAALDDAKADFERVAIRLSIVKANYASLDHVSYVYLSELVDYRAALNNALALDLQSTKGKVARGLRREYRHLIKLEKGAAALLSGNGIELANGERICTFNGGN